jgi:AraC family ethanolamine operon transcriptional activator
VQVLDVFVTSSEELEAAARGWEIRFAQLGAGRCRGRHVAVRAARARFAFESWSLDMLKTGRGPHGSVTFLVPVAGRDARVQGRRVEPGEVTVVLDGDEFHYRSGGAAELVTVCMDRGTLDLHVRALLRRHWSELHLQDRWRGLRADASALRAACLDLARRAADPRALADPTLATSLEARLVKLLLGRFDEPRACEAQDRGRRLALRAEAWLRQNLSEPPTIAALCQAVSASERTLHEAFRAHLDTTPMAYLKALRLNAAYHGLLEGGARRRVTDVALDWGFLHFGWFSQDYRRHFGETPSQTLQRGRALGRPLPARRAALQP